VPTVKPLPRRLSMRSVAALLPARKRVRSADAEMLDGR
jgi:hypothetical protein